MNILYPTILSALSSLDVTLKVVRIEDTAYVKVTAPLYVNKHYTLLRSWSTDFTDAEILEEAAELVAFSYGVRAASGFTTHSF